MGRQQINLKFGSIDGLCSKLGVDPAKGLPRNEDDLKMRRERFGVNKIPMKRPRTFLLLVWDSLKDVILIILIISALISLGLSFYKPEEDISGKNFNKSNFKYRI